MSRKMGEVDFSWNGDRAVSRVEEGMEEGLRVGLNALLAESRAQVPLDRGLLMLSGGTDHDGLTGTVYYDSPYAVRQHEELGYHHQRGRKAKYLEDPVNDPQLRGKIQQYIAKEIKNRI